MNTAPPCSERAVYSLPLAGTRPDAETATAATSRRHLPTVQELLLADNVIWFCRLRWAVAAILLAFGLASQLPGLFSALGLRQSSVWPLLCAASVALTNLAFLLWTRSPTAHQPTPNVRLVVWTQIVVDLLILTVVVYCVGSQTTYIAFAYLFHVVLATIFLPRPQSLLVTMIACGLYSLCIAAESIGWLPASSVYAQLPGPEPTLVRIGNALSAQAIWLVVWFLASRLTAIVRARDDALAMANQQLIEAQHERAHHMLRTTHELKAPFAAIHANTQVLLAGYCGNLPDDARDVISRINTRSRRLARAIQDMLQLTNLNSDVQTQPAPHNLDLIPLLEDCLAELQGLSQARGIQVKLTKLTPALLSYGARDHFHMLFQNLIANAVAYSHPNGRVDIRCQSLPGHQALIVIEDQGIGIAPAKLPHVFEEYFRTEQAISHCSESTGLGLAIVKRVAETYAIAITVSSQPGLGTKFELRFPAPQLQMSNDQQQEKNHVVSDDCR